MKKKILFVLEIVVLMIFIGVLYLYGQVNAKLEKIEQPVLHEEEIVINPEVRENVLSGYSTYALFGIDRRTKNEELIGENSDTIIIASVNNDTGEVKLVSVFRDTVLDVGGGVYSKANSAYGTGGPEKAISMLNTNLDLNITDYVTIDFNALATVVDILGGLDIPLSYAEIDHMNHYCVETARETGKTYTPVELPEEKPQTPEELEAVIGTYHLNGVQVVSYCRIRYTASLDMGRTARQRTVISLLVSKAKKAGLTTIFQIMDEVFPMVQTSLNQTEILRLIPAMIGYRLGLTSGFPLEYQFADMVLGDDTVSIIAPISLEQDVIDLHKFLYGENVPYTPSAQVSATSARISEIIADGGQELSITETPEEEVYGGTYEDPSDYGNTDGNDYGYDIYDDNNDNNDYNDYSDDYGNDYNDYDNDDGSDYDDGYNDDYNDYDNDSGYDSGDYGGGTEDGGFQEEADGSVNDVSQEDYDGGLYEGDYGGSYEEDYGGTYEEDYGGEF